MTDVILPAGVNLEDLRDDAPDRVVIDNRTDLPDYVVEEAVKDVFVENASLSGIERSTFQTYANEGGLLARKKFVTPSNVIEEIRLARDLAERDDDVAAAIGEAVAVAFGDGLEHQDEDETTVALFQQMARKKYINLQGVLADMYRELLISSQINTATLFTREQIDYTLQGSSRRLKKSLAVPMIGILHAENIRVIGNDTFHTGRLAYLPPEESVRKWLREYFGERTSPARKAQMGREDRVSANLFTGRVPDAILNQEPTFVSQYGATEVYYLNERMVHRSTFPKGEWKYPRPLLTRDFSLLEAKRLLNIMDYALLQGGSNYIVVAKKGTDKRPATKEEVESLSQVVRTASRTGVIVGDHRLDFEVITPKMEGLLNPDKRRLLGRKIVQGLLRIPEGAQDKQVTGAGTDPELESKARVITSDRDILLGHVEDYIYDEVVRRNAVFVDSPTIAVPKIVLQGSQYFTEYLLKLRDRGDIPRRWAVQYAGFNFDAAIEQRKREVEQGVDEIMVPAEVPFSSPGSPQDNNTGRPPGSKDKPPGATPEITPPGQPKQLLQRNPGETIKSWYEEDADQVVRMGETTYAILDQFEERSVGRVTNTERDVLAAIGEEAMQRGSVFYVPVNPAYAVEDLKAIRLDDGLSMIVGSTPQGAIVAKMFAFRNMEFTAAEAEDVVLRWGYPIKMPQPVIETAALQQPPIIMLTQGSDGKMVRRVIDRDETGAIIGSHDEPIPDPTEE